MRLGFWNRLAVVAFVLGVVGGPTWYVFSVNSELAELQQARLDTCTAVAASKLDNKANEKCWDEFTRHPSRFLGRQEWFEAIPAAALSFAVIYAIIACAVQIAKWVWRGRIPD